MNSAFFFRAVFIGVLLMCSRFAQAQLNAVHTFGNVVSYSGAWVKAGTLTLQQGGHNAYFQFYAGVGYNAWKYQNGHVELFIRTSNGATTDPQGFGFTAYATRFGENSFFLQHIRVVPNAAGAAATVFDVYFYNEAFIGDGVYHVIAGLGGSWTNVMVQQSPPAGMDVPFEFRTNNDAYLGGSLFVSASNGNVGVGTTSPASKLSVNGEVLAKKVRVTQTGWPDYVFRKDYTLMPLPAVEAHIKAHGHLPGIPVAKEVEKNGLDIGETQSALLRKIEELTLHVIDLHKKMGEQQRVIARQEKKLEEQGQLIRAMKR